MHLIAKELQIREQIAGIAYNKILCSVPGFN